MQEFAQGAFRGGVGSCAACFGYCRSAILRKGHGKFVFTAEIRIEYCKPAAIVAL